MLCHVIEFACGMGLSFFGSVDDWPNWRGPHHDGISRETDWVDHGAKDHVWKRSVGLGYSCPSIQDGRLFTMGFDPDLGVDVISCLDAFTGDELWTHRTPAEPWNKYHEGGTNTTPIVSADRLYTVSREGVFQCLSSTKGHVIWSKDLKSEYELNLPTWGFAASPLILESDDISDVATHSEVSTTTEDSTVFLSADRLMAFDATTGALRWKTSPFGGAYSTPVAFQIEAQTCVASMTAVGLIIVQASDGVEVARYDWKTQEDVNAASPVVVGDRLFISSGYNHGGALLEFGEEGAKPVWANKIMRNKVSTSVYWEGHLYGFDESVLKCVDLEGEEKWRKTRLGRGALSASNGKLLVMTSRGELAIVEARSDQYTELSKTKVLDGGVYWTMPVISNGFIYCRNNHGDLVCLDHRASSATPSLQQSDAHTEASEEAKLPIVHGISRDAVDAYWKKGTKPPTESEFTELALRDGVPLAVAVFHAVREEQSDYIPFDFKAWRDFGWYRLSQGKTRDAVLANTLLVEAFPDIADSYRRLADSLVAMHREDEAILNLERALELDPNHKQARSLLEQLKE